MAKKVVKKSKKKTAAKPWQVGKNVGRGLGSGAGNPRKIETPELLYSYFEEFKNWCEENSYDKVVGTFEGQPVTVRQNRPHVFKAFEGYLSSRNIVFDLSHYERHVDYRPIISRIKKECSQDCLQGAMVGFYNANLTSRLEGLAENQNVVVEDNRKEVGDLFPLDDTEQ